MELKIPPMLLFLLTLALSWSSAELTPWLTLAMQGSAGLALVVVVSGVCVVLSGALTFRILGTTMNPVKPEQATLLVTRGVYRYSRNPMYLGFLLLILGCGIYLENLFGIFLFPLAFVVYMNRYQILPEEQVLLARFGETYLQYMNRVRRWI